MDSLLSVLLTFVHIMAAAAPEAPLVPTGATCLAAKTIVVVSRVEMRSGPATIYVPVRVCDVWIGPGGQPS